MSVSTTLNYHYLAKTEQKYRGSKKKNPLDELIAYETIIV